MSVDHNAEGQVIKRLSFGDMSSHQLLHGEEATCQRNDPGAHNAPDDLDTENDENTFKEAWRGPAMNPKSLRDKQAEYHRALEEIRPTSSRFNALEEAARAEYKETGPGKLASLKDQFSKSKFEYVELETKEHFVRAIAEEGDRVLAGEEVKGSFLLEGVVGNQKAKVQELKRHKEQTGLAINKIIDQIATEMSELEKEQHVVEGELEACEDALQTWERTHEALAAAQSGENKEDLEELHSRQEAQLARLAEQESSAQQAGVRNKEDADRLAEEIAALETKLQEAQAESLRLEQAAEQVGKVSRSTEVHEEMLQLLHDLAGISLTASTDRELHFLMTTHITALNSRTGKLKHVPVKHELAVALHPDTSEIEDAMLSPADVDVSDVVATVRGTQRLDALVRELRQRASCYAVRKDQVARATRTTKYKMRTDQTTMIQVALPATNIIANVDAPYDWPSPGVPLKLESLLTRKGIPAFQDDVLEMILDRINRSVAAQEGDLVCFVQSIELELQKLELV